MKISIIIVTYNSINLIKDCVESIFKYNDIGENLDVIIADNASVDQLEMFNLIKREFDSNRVRVYDTGKNGGYGWGNNFGISKTKADIVIVVNPDVRFVSPIFKTILNEFKDPTLGMVGVEFIDGSSPYYFKPEYQSFLHEILIHLFIKFRRYNPKTMYMSGSLLAFNRKVFFEAGQYDENIFLYYEEPDITNRIQNIGKKVKWLKGVMVQHLAHGRKFNQKLTDISNESFEYYCSKYNIDAMKYYRIKKIILQLKICISKFLRNTSKMDLFSNTLKCVKDRIKELCNY